MQHIIPIPMVMHAFSKKEKFTPCHDPLERLLSVFQVQDNILHSAIWSSMFFLSSKLGEYNLKTVIKEILECKGLTHFWVCSENLLHLLALIPKHSQSNLPTVILLLINKAAYWLTRDKSPYIILPNTVNYSLLTAVSESHLFAYDGIINTSVD